jgi:hypothetical protein
MGAGSWIAEKENLWPNLVHVSDGRESEFSVVSLNKHNDSEYKHLSLRLGEQVCGFLSYRVIEGGHPMFLGLEVSEEHQGKNLGMSMLKHFVNQAPIVHQKELAPSGRIFKPMVALLLQKAGWKTLPHNLETTDTCTVEILPQSKYHATHKNPHVLLINGQVPERRHVGKSLTPQFRVMNEETLRRIMPLHLGDLPRVEIGLKWLPEGLIRDTSDLSIRAVHEPLSKPRQNDAIC